MKNLREVRDALTEVAAELEGCSVNCFGGLEAVRTTTKAEKKLAKRLNRIALARMIGPSA